MGADTSSSVLNIDAHIYWYYLLQAKNVGERTWHRFGKLNTDLVVIDSSSPVFSLFLICAGGSTGTGYHLCIMPRPALSMFILYSWYQKSGIALVSSFKFTEGWIRLHPNSVSNISRPKLKSVTISSQEIWDILDINLNKGCSCI